MSLTRRVLVVLEQRPQITETEMSLHILRLQSTSTRRVVGGGVTLSTTQEERDCL